MATEIETLQTWARTIKSRIDAELAQRGGNAPLGWYRELWAV